MVERDRGPGLITTSGRYFFPFDPRAEEVDFGDIAHSLSLQCRFSGHTFRHFSVAQHSLNVAFMCEAEEGPVAGLYGLLHDASEAYLIDLPAPLKRHGQFSFFLSLERRIQEVIWDAVRIPRAVPEIVEIADRIACEREMEEIVLCRGMGLVQPRPSVMIEREFRIHLEKLLSAGDVIELRNGER